MQMDHAESLRLVAKDEADLEVVSALLQDAIVAGADMHYDEQDFLRSDGRHGVPFQYPHNSRRVGRDA